MEASAFSVKVSLGLSDFAFMKTIKIDIVSNNENYLVRPSSVLAVIQTSTYLHIGK